MATASTVTAKIKKLINKSNNTTGKRDTDLTESVNSLIDGYREGAGITEYDGKYNITGTPTGDDYETHINGIIREYEVAAGANVKAGDFVEFITKCGAGYVDTTGASSLLTAVYKLSDTQVLCLLSWYYLVRITFDDEITFDKPVELPISIIDRYLAEQQCFLIDASKLFIISKTENKYYWYCAHITEDGISVPTLEELTSEANTHYSTTLPRCGCAVGERVVLFTEPETDASYGYLRLLDAELNLQSSYGVYMPTNIDQKHQGYCALVSIDNEDFVALPPGNKENVARYSVGNSSIALVQTGSTYSGYDDNVYKPRRAFNVSSGVIRCFYRKYNSMTSVLNTKISYSANSISMTAIAGFIVGTNAAFDATAILNGRVVSVSRNENSTYATISIENGASVELHEPITAVKLVPFGNSILMFAEVGSDIMFLTITIDGDNIILDETRSVTVKPAKSTLKGVGVAKTSGTEGETVQVYCAV